MEYLILIGSGWETSYLLLCNLFNLGNCPGISNWVEDDKKKMRRTVVGSEGSTVGGIEQVSWLPLNRQFESGKLFYPQFNVWNEEWETFYQFLCNFNGSSEVYKGFRAIYLNWKFYSGLSNFHLFYHLQCGVSPPLHIVFLHTFIRLFAWLLYRNVIMIHCIK